MQFTYAAYVNMINMLRKGGYQFVDYTNCDCKGKSVIMRHDIDYSIDRAVELAKLEKEQKVSSTYFVLLSSPFYNVMAKDCLEKLRRIKTYGHNIGLHFDELNYTEEYYHERGGITKVINEEVDILKKATGLDIKAVSMHRPSKKTLDADYDLNPLINTYGKKFFKKFKYVSDSRRRWRENVNRIISSGEYDKLHILTHAFWYGDCEKNLKESLLEFIESGKNDYYKFLYDNFSDLDEVIDICEI